MHVPGLKVVCPSNPYGRQGALARLHSRSRSCVIFFEPKRVYRAAKGLVPEEDFIVPIGSAAIVREGDGVTVVAYGAMPLYEALDAATKAAEKGASKRKSSIYERSGHSTSRRSSTSVRK